MKIAIIIPARYGSTRFPGKPLTMIAGETMLSRVVDIARDVQTEHSNIRIAVATEDRRIADHCDDIGVTCVMTSENCPTGSDRVLEAAEKIDPDLDFVVGLQGDAPFTPKDAIMKMIAHVQTHPECEVVTPVLRLRWEVLDQLRENKKTTPFSGTTAIIAPDGQALWFSKNIIPAIRKEASHRENTELSPVHQHIGLYGYRLDVLRRYVRFPQSHYELLEGLEQLRLLENGIKIHTVETLEVDDELQGGIDSPEDVARVERVLKVSVR